MSAFSICSASHLEAGIDHHTSSSQSGQGIQNGTWNPSFWSTAWVTNSVEEATDKEGQQKEDSCLGEDHTDDQSWDDIEGDLLEESDLGSLPVVDVVPLVVGKLHAISAIACVRVPKFRGFGLPREGLAVFIVELLHEGFVEGTKSGPHGHEVDGEEVLESNGHDQEQDPEERLWDLHLWSGSWLEIHLETVNQILNNKFWIINFDL